MVSTQFIKAKLDHLPFVGIGIKTVGNHHLVYVCKHTYMCIHIQTNTDKCQQQIDQMITQVQVRQSFGLMNIYAATVSNIAPRPFLPLPWRQVPDNFGVSIDSGDLEKNQNLTTRVCRKKVGRQLAQPWLLCPWRPPLQ